MKLDIAVALRRNQRRWINRKMTWDQLVERFSETQRTNETFREYLRAPKTLQADIKDVGGFVGGYLDGGKRSPSTVRHRQVVALDIDESDLTLEDGLFDKILKGIPYELVIYSTHKHAPEKPRIRVVFPLDRPVSADEYEAISRYLAGEVGIDFFDPTTFQPSRFMHWPSTSSDGEFFFHYEMGAVCPADEILSRYVDWKDISAWPRLATEEASIHKETGQLGDPTEKEGLIGAFCRAYNVEEAIELFLPNVYEKTDTGRYTFLDGSGASGGIVYGDGKFFYSHHSTDPVGGKLVNAFDLVRIHKFGGLDTDTEKPMSKRESFIEMSNFAIKDNRVTSELDAVAGTLKNAIYMDFADELSEADWLGDPIDVVEDVFKKEVETVNLGNVPEFYKPAFKGELPGGINETNWKDSLERDKKGNIEPKITNLKLIILFDEDLKGKIALNDFENSIYVTGALPWNPSTSLRMWEDSDEAGLRELLETKYDVYHVSKVVDAFVLSATYNRFHPVREFLNNLEWDGKERLDTLFIDHMGAEDTAYTRAVTRKAFTAAVARVMQPGCKFDYVLTLIGAEGLKKSSLFAEMGGRWFSDSFTTVEGTRAFEQLQGSWIIEIAELSAFNRAETNHIKAFITKRTDKYRSAYGKLVRDYPRQCVFFATTNDYAFLKGTTGNRRFWPIEVTKRFQGNAVAEKSANGAEAILGLPIQQLWAEAKYRFEKGEKLYLSDDLEHVARQMQENFAEEDTRLGDIENFLEMKLPLNWDAMSRMERRDFINGDSMFEGVETRNFVCINEIWEECLGMDKRDLTPFKSKEITGLMQKVKGWVRRDARRTFHPYGQRRYFERVTVEEKV